MKNLYLAILALATSFNSFAQTDPAAQALPFVFTSQANATLPPGIAMHKFASIPITRTVAPASADLPYIAAPTSGGWNAQGSNGIGILASGTNPAGAMVVAVNTTGKTGVTVTWKVTTILNQASRDNSIALQYRIGTTGNFINVGTTSTYSSTGTIAGDAQSFLETLPVATDNKPVVELRWIFWESAGTAGSRDRLAITNIRVAQPSGPCAAPASQPTGLAFGVIDAVSIAGSFAASAPPADEYLVVASTNTTLTSGPVNGQVYDINNGLGDGFVVARGNATSFTAIGLSASTTYYFFVFAVNNYCTGGPLYLAANPLAGSAATTAGLPNCAAPAAQPTGLTFTSSTANDITGSFTATIADEYLVLRSTASTLTATPANGTVYSPGGILRNATVVQEGSNLNFDAGGLTPNTAYNFFIFSVGSLNCVNGPAYNITSALTGIQSTKPLSPCAAPPAQPTNLLLTPSNNAVAGNFSPSAGTDHYLVIRSSTTTLSAAPADNINYNPGDIIGGGTVISNSTNYSFVSESLSPNSTYYFFVYAFNKVCTGGTKYQAANPLTGNTTTLSVAANNFYFGNLHSHSDYSDGNKDHPGYTPADDYLYAMTSQCLDYLGISEHNHFSNTNNPGNLIANYHMGSIQANSFTSSHTGFLALYGMEWGVTSGGGHVVIYGDGMDKLFGWESNVGGAPGPNYDVFVEKSDYTGAAGLFKTINDYRSFNTFATLAHPFTSDFNGVAYNYDAVADSAITGVAVESGPALSANTTYTDPPASMYYLPYFQMMLSKGYHLGPTIDHDNHNTTFGHTFTSRTAIIAPTLNKTEIVKAMRDMHFYATQDCDSKVTFTMNTRMMGSVFEDRQAPVLIASLTDATTSTTGAVIKVMFGVPGSNILAAQIYSTTGNILNFTDNSLPDLATGYYYLDIKNGTSRIITSPIWYTRHDATVLPVTLSSFNVEKQTGSVRIYWSTAQEINSGNFIVQHSMNGHDWQDIINIPATGFSNVSLSYQGIDHSPQFGINYYRLKQVDRDGKFQYSVTRSVLFNQGQEVLITPNPASDLVTIYFSNSARISTSISIYTANGQLIKNYTTTSSSLPLDVSGYTRGLYFIKIQAGAEVIVEKLLVVNGE